MAFGKALVLLVAALSLAAAQHDPIPSLHDPAYDPFFHPTGRPKQNSLAGATSQQSPGFPEISKLLPLVQADTIGPTLNTATTKVIVVATWDFGNPAAVTPMNLFRPAATGRRLLQTFTSPGSCIIDDPSLGPNVAAANAQACNEVAAISANCTCPTAGRKLLSSTGRDLLQTLQSSGAEQFFGECKEDFFSLLANCNYVFDAASALLRANLQIGFAGNTFVSCTLFYDDGSYVDSATCFTTAGDAPTVVRLNAKAIEYAKNPTTGQAAGTQPGARISPQTFFAANYIAPNGFRFSLIFRPVQTFGVYINQEHQVFPGQ